MIWTTDPCEKEAVGHVLALNESRLLSPIKVDNKPTDMPYASFANLVVKPLFCDTDGVEHHPSKKIVAFVCKTFKQKKTEQRMLTSAQTPW